MFKHTLKLHLFWRKTISRNDFTPHRVFGCAWKIEFSGKAFHLTVNIMALTRKLFYISIFTSKNFRTQTRKERERERRDHWYSPSHRAPSSPSCQTQPILSFTLLRKFPLSSENFSPHSLSSFTPSPSRRTERAIVGEAQIQSPTHGPVGLIALLKPITDLITPPQLLHHAQTHLQ